MRVMLFTDTLGDVNGVSRFVDNMSQAALVPGAPFRDQPLAVVTSTRFPVPLRNNILNLCPSLSFPMPAYPQLQLALPPVLKLRHAFRDFNPDVVHISTPGPVGLTGLALARRARIPVVGVYHTDFPAYLDNLFNDDGLTAITARAMAAVYTRFTRVLTRSDDYAKRLVALGVRPANIATLTPGIDLVRFSPEFRDPSVWNALGVPGSTLKVLYVGRVSVEKNLPFLAGVWRHAHAVMRSNANVNARPAVSLVIVGDGPYLGTMQRELANTNAHFLGFRHAEELSALYASSDVFVFPSTTDTLGQVVLEAQASGLPVLVTDQGGPQGVVRDGVTGLVRPATEPAAWACTIQGLLIDTPRRQSMSQAAAQWARSMPIRSSFESFWKAHQGAVTNASAQPSS